MTTISTSPDIEIRTAFTISLPDGHGHTLDASHVPHARETPPGGIVEITITGEVTYVYSGCFMGLATVLADASRVIVRANGSGARHLHGEVTRAINSELDFRRHAEESRAVRRASLERQVRDGYLPADVLDEGGAA